MRSRRDRAGAEERAADDSASALAFTLRHTFRDPALLQLALTHRSFIHDRVSSLPPTDAGHPPEDNERLEFLGDAVLGLLVADSLYRRFPAAREGELTRLRASLVSRRHLGGVGARLELGRSLRLGLTAEKNDGRINASLGANAVEAIVGALYLDAGIEAARTFVEREIVTAALPQLQRSMDSPEQLSGAVGDHKSALQETLQARGLGTPRYSLLEESGPDHRRCFRVEVRLDGKQGEPGRLAEAEGPSKKQAQQEAARLALVALAGQGDDAWRAVPNP